ncbi:MAG: phosphodiester glycosidase family protein [Pseudomonadota bacterium]
MKRAFLLLAGVLALTACEQPKAGEPVVTVNLGDETTDEIAPASQDGATPALATGPSTCAQKVFEEVAFTHCIADPDEHVISAAYSAPGQSEALGSLGALAEIVDAGDVAFAMNGGAFSDDLTPRGYLVASGDRIAELDRGSGDGNFYLKPNGVFFGGSGRWRILTTSRFLNTVSDRPQFGTQSGPMLLVGGELGDAISEDGNSRAVRNGVGVDGDGKAHFVISNAPVSFGLLARFLRDEAGARDALFLDANSSSLWDPATGRMDTGRTGPILLVSKKASS